MNDQLLVLNALLRLARRRVPATFSEIETRVGLAAARVRGAIASLAQSGLVRRHATGHAVAQLTLVGFAIAVAHARRTATCRREAAPAKTARRAA